MQRARVPVHHDEELGAGGDCAAAVLRLQAQHGWQRLREVQAVPLRPALGTSHGEGRQRMQRSDYEFKLNLLEDPLIQCSQESRASLYKTGSPNIYTEQIISDYLLRNDQIRWFQKDLTGLSNKITKFNNLSQR